MAYLLFPGSTLLVFRTMLFGNTNMAIPYHLGSIWPWRAEQSVELTRRIIATDQADTYYPWAVAVQRSLRSHHLPFWNPNNFAGTPLWTNGQPSPLYPFRFLTSFFIDPSLQHDIFIIFHLVLAGFGMYFLCKSLGFNAIACLAGGLFWMFSPLGFAWMQFEFFLPLLAYLPWIFLLVKNLTVYLKTLEEKSSFKFLVNNLSTFFWLCFIQTMLILGSNIQFALLGIAPAYIYLLIAIFNAKNQSYNRIEITKSIFFSIKVFSYTSILTLCISATTWLPILVFSSKTSRAVFSYSQFVDNARTVKFESFWKNTSTHLPYPYIIEHLGQMTFVGLFASIFAIIGFIYYPKTKENLNTNFARIIAATTLLVCTGTPLAWVVYKFIPGLQQLASLGRLLFLWTFALCVLSAYGIYAISKTTMKYCEKIKINKSTTKYLTYGILSIIVFLNVWQTTIYGFLVNPPISKRNAENIFPTTPAIEKLKEIMTPEDRIIPIMRGDNIAAPPIFYTSHQVVYNINSAAGYDSLISSNSVDTWRSIGGDSTEVITKIKSQGSYISLYQIGKVNLAKLPKVGITLILGSPDIEDDTKWKSELAKSNLNLQKVYSGTDAVIFRIENQIPKTFTSAVCTKTKKDELDKVNEVTIPLVLTNPNNQNICSSKAKEVKNIKITYKSSDDPNKLIINVKASEKHILYVPVTNDDGWSASANGKTLKIINANHSFMALELPKGNHNVVFAYSPPGFRISVIITLLGLGVFVLLGVYTRRRKTT